eukprot:jgi/Psemu1/19441/gm1.19441_g
MAGMETIADATRCMTWIAMIMLTLRTGGFIFLKSKKATNYDKLIKKKHIQRMSALHAPVLYLVFYLSEGVACNPDFPSSRNAFVEILVNILSIPLAILLWDGGAIHTNNPTVTLLFALHHAPTVAILPYHIYESNSVVASRNTHLFEWLWLAHSFTFIHTYVFPILGLKKASDGNQRYAFKLMRYAYACKVVTVLYFLHQWRRSTRRWLELSNSMLNLFAYRKATAPGTVFIYSSAMCGYNTSLGVLATAVIYACCLARSIWKPSICPAKWDPMHPEIAKVLSKYEKKFLTEFPDGLLPGFGTSPVTGLDAFSSWWEGNPDWREKYPVITAVALNDVEKLENLIKGGANLYTRMFEIRGSTVDEWTVHAGRIRCTILILKAGLDPWQIHGNNSMWRAAEFEKMGPLLEMKAELEPIVLKAYPPVTQGSIFGRCWKCISSF